MTSPSAPPMITPPGERRPCCTGCCMTDRGRSRRRMQAGQPDRARWYESRWAIETCRHLPCGQDRHTREFPIGKIDTLIRSTCASVRCPFDSGLPPATCGRPELHAHAPSLEHPGARPLHRPSEMIECLYTFPRMFLRHSPDQPAPRQCSFRVLTIRDLRSSTLANAAGFDSRPDGQTNCPEPENCGTACRSRFANPHGSNIEE